MNLIAETYKTKNLAYYGRFISCCLVALILIGPFIIPRFIPHTKKQMLGINGNYLKYDDKEIVTDYFNSIKSNNGYLCLGTSETTSIKGGGNYYNFLNDDPDLNVKFSVLAGAGRTCAKYIPIFLNHKEDVKHLKVFYYINPVYWRDDLINPSKTYWKRYSNYGVIKNVHISDAEKERYFKEVNYSMNNFNSGEKTTFLLDYWLRKFRTSYFQDLCFWGNSDSYIRSNSFVKEIKNDLSIYKSFGKVDYELIDTVSNETRGHSIAETFKPTTQEINYRYDELISFINLCKDLEVDVTYILGPYNGRLIQNHYPEALEGYELTMTNVRKILTESNVSYIDASDNSMKAGTLSDPMHNSSYGAYLIYKKMKNYVYEREN